MPTNLVAPIKPAINLPSCKLASNNSRPDSFTRTLCVLFLPAISVLLSTSFMFAKLIVAREGLTWMA